MNTFFKQIPIIICILLISSAIAQTQNHSEKNAAPLWQYKFDSQLWSPMTFDNGILYLGSDSGEFYAFDILTQKIKWSFNTGARIRSGSTLIKNKIVFVSDDGYLYTLNAKTGKLIWRFQLDQQAVTRRLPALEAPYEYDYLHSTPVYYDGVLFVGSTKGNLYALFLEDGKIHWKFSSKNKIRSTPVIRNGLAYVGSWDGHMYAIDINDGKLFWSFNTGDIVQDTPVYAANTLFFGSRSTNFYAINATTGELRWKFKHEDNSWAESSPIFDKGIVYVGSSDALSLFAFDSLSGKIRWQFKNTGWNWARPTLANNTIYIGAISAHPYYFEGITLTPGFYAVDKNTGEKRWQFVPEKLKSFVSGGIFAPAVVQNGTVYVASIDGYLYAFKE